MTVSVHIRPVVMRSMMIVARRYDLASLDHYRTKLETHRRLGRRLRTLRKIELGLAHNCGEILLKDVA